MPSLVDLRSQAPPGRAHLAPPRQLRLAHVLIIAWLLIAPAAAAESRAALTSRLLDNYHAGPGVRPSVAEADAMSARGESSCVGRPEADNVEVQVYVDQFQPINMLRQTYEIDGFLRAWWSDPRLRFNGTDDGDAVREASRRKVLRRRGVKFEQWRCSGSHSSLKVGSHATAVH